MRAARKAKWANRGPVTKAAYKAAKEDYQAARKAFGQARDKMRAFLRAHNSLIQDEDVRAKLMPEVAKLMKEQLMADVAKPLPEAAKKLMEGQLLPEQLTPGEATLMLEFAEKQLMPELVEEQE